MASAVTFALTALLIAASLKTSLDLLDPGNRENTLVTAIFVGIVMSVTLAVGSFLPILGLIALLTPGFWMLHLFICVVDAFGMRQAGLNTGPDHAFVGVTLFSMTTACASKIHIELPPIPRHLHAT